MILLIDNYDSFTYNLAQLAGQFAEIRIIRNDDPLLLQAAEQAEKIIISPGPGRPEEAGELAAVIRRYYKEKPILGICLGHQAIGQVFGGAVQQAKQVFHGKSSRINKRGGRLLVQLAEQFEVIRYHSLIIAPHSLPEEFEVTAYSEEDQEIMAIEHKKYPLFGLQFHPESIGSPDGAAIIEAFVQQTGGETHEGNF